MAIALQEVKAHLNVTTGDDDALIERLLAAAIAHVRRRLGFAVDDAERFPDGPPADLEQAVMMLVAHWYENREDSVVGLSAQFLPLGIEDILREHRDYTYG
jgi:uncharacterized phage protein (predicted DNA packaging)